ncbi:MAG: hypothetical protein IKF39_01875 [Oscillospiraceae bacterium]|nr:hypothetical protein [Oscillospiraceae bacterium]
MGYCESCAKVRECKKTIGIMFGYCPTDFVRANSMHEVKLWLDYIDGRISKTEHGYTVECYGDSTEYKSLEAIKETAHYTMRELIDDGAFCAR